MACTDSRAVVSAVRTKKMGGQRYRMISVWENCVTTVTPQRLYSRPRSAPARHRGIGRNWRAPGRRPAHHLLVELVDDPGMCGEVVQLGVERCTWLSGYRPL